MSTSNHTTEIPYGYCHCGCGQKTNLHTRNNSRSGALKGEPYKFVAYHHQRLEKTDPIKRFWSKVNKDGSIPAHRPELGACWEWTASKSYYGYGQFTIDKRPYSASRFAYSITYGEIPDRMKVLHKCDNPPCCNPSHLFLGTQKDNIEDMKQKGRDNWANGERAGCVKLSVEKVRFIREAYAKGNISQRGLARMMSVSNSTIGAILKRKTWQHVI